MTGEKVGMYGKKVWENFEGGKPQNGSGRPLALIVRNAPLFVLCSILKREIKVRDIYRGWSPRTQSEDDNKWPLSVEKVTPFGCGCVITRGVVCGIGDSPISL